MRLSRGNRLCRSRRKGVKLPDGAVYVGRPTMWGNPFMGRRWGHAKSVILHRRWLTGNLGAMSLERMGFCPAEIDALARLRSRIFANLHPIAGKDLACWCPVTSNWCHAEALLDLAAQYAAAMETDHESLQTCGRHPQRQACAYTLQRADDHPPENQPRMARRTPPARQPQLAHAPLQEGLTEHENPG